MNTPFSRFICRILVVCVIGLPSQALAGLIGTDQVAGASQAEIGRAALVSFVNRTEVAQQLQALGLSPKVAQERVAALTDAEVATLAQQIETLPAGAHSVEVLLIVVFILFLWWTIQTTSR